MSKKNYEMIAACATVIHNKSSAVAETVAQCCTTGIVRIQGGSVLRVRQFAGEKRALAVIDHTLPSTRIFGLHFCLRHYTGSSFRQFNAAGAKSYRLGEMTEQNRTEISLLAAADGQ